MKSERTTIEPLAPVDLAGYVQEGQKVLVISRSFRPYFFYRLLSALTFGYFRKYFEYQSNPRPLQYLLERSWKPVGDALAHKNVSVEWCFIDFDNASTRGLTYLSRLPAHLDEYDAFVLLYPDSLGIGFYGIERRLGSTKKPIVAVNGRNRMFLFAPARKELYVKRFLEKYLIFELAFSVLFVLATPFYLVYSLFKPRPTEWKRSAVGKEEYEARQGEAPADTVVAAVDEFWSTKPMTYGDDHGSSSFKGYATQKGDKAFFAEADKRFYSWNMPLHGREGYFSNIFPYERYRGKRVLEVGCGLGTMSMQWAKHGAEITGVDLTQEAVDNTKKRFELEELQGTFLKADGRKLPFADASFDYVYSWGVLHHSPDLRKSISELYRVLKPGSEIGMMLYSRDSFLHRWLTEFWEGYLHLEHNFLSPLQLASRYGDDYRSEGNPHTWPIKLDEVNYLCGDFTDVDVRVLGTELDYVFLRLIPLVAPLIPRFMKKAYARRYGWSLWITGRKG